MLKLCRLPRTAASVIVCYQLLNCLLVCVALWSWRRVARRLRLTARGELLGLCAIFLTHPVLKFFVFYPVLSDAWALALGLLFLQAYSVQWLLWLHHLIRCAEQARRPLHNALGARA